jgi:gamma-glutamylcyclotransferase (GGCT)/AIG2-like uncharacterized protein YtfP
MTGETIPGTVKGEIYRILDDEAVLPSLDDYEECSARFPEPREYVREIREVFTSGADTIRAWIYLYNHDVSKLKVIESGDYLRKQSLPLLSDTRRWRIARYGCRRGRRNGSRSEPMRRSSDRITPAG